LDTFHLDTCTFLCSYIQIESSLAYALDTKEIHKQLHDDSEIFSQLSQDSDINIFNHTDHDAKISWPGLSDIYSNSAESKATANLVSGRGCGYDDNDNNKVWALWDKNDHDFCMILFYASSGYKPH
jgi:hypothetical protein